MKRVLLVLVLVGCGAPLPDGYRVANQDVATSLALRFWGAPDGAQLPAVLYVDPDCQIGAESVALDGFVADGVCAGGFQDGGDSPWFVSTRGQVRYSGTSLCHEMLHVRIGDTRHRDGRWDSVDDCRAFLARQPGDVMGAGADRPGQEDAIGIVLRSFDEARLPFALEWVADECGWPGSVRTSVGTCAAGAVEWGSPPLVRVGLETPDEPFSATTLAHELCHLHFGDLEHLAECGTLRPASRVLPAESALRAAGL